MLTYDLYINRDDSDYAGGLHNLPLYEQLYMFIKQDILSGELATDTALPSKRTFAKQLNVSVITVENAYNQLLSEGFIYSLPRKGFYVSNIYGEENIYFESNVYKEINRVGLHNSTSQAEHHSTKDNGYFSLHKICDQHGQHDHHDTITGSHHTSATTDKNNNASTITDKDNDISTTNPPSPRNIYDFASNAIETSSFPFTTWRKVTRRTFIDDKDKLMTVSPAKGTYELRSAIAGYLHDFRGINVSPDSIIVGAGTESLYLMLIMIFGNDLTYSYEYPGYLKISQILEAYRVKHVGIPMDSDGVIPEELSKNNVNIIHITPSHHFPTGITMPVKRRYELLHLAAQRSNVTDDFSDIENTRYIIEDDYDSEFRLAGRPIPSLYSMDKNDKVIYMNTFTKSLSSTIRISYMILPKKLMDVFNQRLTFNSNTVSNFEQLPLARFINEGYYEKHINRMRTSYRKKRDILINSIKSSTLGEHSVIHEENSGLHFVLEIKFEEMGKKNTQEEFKLDEIFSGMLEKNGVSLQPLSIFGDTRPHHFMMNYSSIPSEDITKAVEIIEKVAWELGTGVDSQNVSL